MLFHTLMQTVQLLPYPHTEAPVLARVTSWLTHILFWIQPILWNNISYKISPARTKGLSLSLALSFMRGIGAPSSPNSLSPPALTQQMGHAHSAVFECALVLSWVTFSVATVRLVLASVDEAMCVNGAGASVGHRIGPLHVPHCVPFASCQTFWRDHSLRLLSPLFFLFPRSSSRFTAGVEPTFLVLWLLLLLAPPLWCKPIRRGFLFSVGALVSILVAVVLVESGDETFALWRKMFSLLSSVLFSFRGSLSCLVLIQLAFWGNGGVIPDQCCPPPRPSWSSPSSRARIPRGEQRKKSLAPSPQRLVGPLPCFCAL